MRHFFHGKKPDPNRGICTFLKETVLSKQSPNWRKITHFLHPGLVAVPLYLHVHLGCVSFSGKYWALNNVHGYEPAMITFEIFEEFSYLVLDFIPVCKILMLGFKTCGKQISVV
jgi:hypothetical protein